MPAKVKTFSELAMEYGVCRNTLRKWIKPIEKELNLTRRALHEWQVKKIYLFLDEPR
jgi:transposase-like protein